AGDRRWITAITTEGAAIIAGLWGLNYARLLWKWGGDASIIEMVGTAVLAVGCIAASVLFIRARPQATAEEWFRGSAIFGAGLWIVGLRHGPGSRAGLGLAAVMLSTALLVGMFETVQQAPAIGRGLMQVMDDPQLETLREWDGTIPGIAGPPRPDSETGTDAPVMTADVAGPADLDPLGIFTPSARSRPAAADAVSDREPSTADDGNDDGREDGRDAAETATDAANTGGVAPRTGVPMPERHPRPDRSAPQPSAERIEPPAKNAASPADRRDRRVTPSRHRS
ncbi:MAG: hypothetical protein ACYTEV_06815, partial [Planctomycetota bacterium]